MVARLAHREPQRRIENILGWRDAACRLGARGLWWRQSDPTRRRLNRGGRLSTARRWDDLVQKLCDSHTAASLLLFCCTADLRH